MPAIRGKGAYSGGWPITYDAVTGEVTMYDGPIWFYDDFMGAGHTSIPTTVSAGSTWCAKLVKTGGNPQVGAPVNAGVVQVALDATSEKQDAVLYCFDQRCYSGANGLGYETRLQIPVLPTSGTKCVFGMAAAWADGPDNIAAYLRFAVNGNGLILAESYDGTTRLSVSTGVTVQTTSEWHVLRLDASDPTSAKFFIDGNPVCATTTFPFAATGLAAQMQPYASAYKASGTSVGTFQLDYVQITQNSR